MDNKPEGFKIEDYKYKTHREQIEKAWDSYLEKVDFNQILSEFFGISKELINLITTEEKARIKLYFGHVYKRLVNAYLVQSRKDNNDVVVRIDYDQESDRISKDKPDPEKYFELTLHSYFKRIMFHDVSHSTEFASAPEAKDIVPPFFKLGSREGINKLELTQSESFAGLFQKQIRSIDSPLSLELLRKEGVQKVRRATQEVLDVGTSLGYVWRPEMKDFFERECVYKINKIDSTVFTKQNYIDAYLGFIQAGATLGQNLADMSNLFTKKMEAGEVAELEVMKRIGYGSPEDQDAAERIARDGYVSAQVPELLKNIKYAIDHPPRVVVESLEYVYDNRYNPRVLVDLFFKLTETYFDRLEKRYLVKRP